MRVLFDQNVPNKLRQSLTRHEVQIADEMGWSALENGELLRVAESTGFAAFVTCDQNLVYQQNLKGRRLALVVLTTNNWNSLKKNIAPVIQAVDAAVPGSFRVVAIEVH